MRTYDELIQLSTFKERFEYLYLNGVVGEETFGYDRYLNQLFYTSEEWKRIRRKVIVRDNGCDLGLAGYDISGPIYVHHMNPIMLKHIANKDLSILDPNYLVCTSFNTHNAIHYGSYELILANELIERQPNDTCPWRKPNEFK